MRKTKEQNSKHKKTNTNKGITLIALVITIVVMLILVAVTISMAVNGGLFDYAGNAGTQTNEAIANEQILAQGKVNVDGKWYNNIDDYIAGKALPSTYEEAEFKNGLLAENATFTSDGYTAVIPEGFKIIKGRDGTQSIAKGLVIQDAKGNEFVWIPVTYTATGVKDDNGLDTGFLATFKRSTTSTSYTEPYASGYSDGKGTEEAKDYYDMMKSVQANKGFYIGRYEAGIEPTYIEDGVEKTNNARTDTSNKTSKVVVKRDCYPYNYVGWGSSMSEYENTITYNSKDQGHGAVYLSKHLLDGQTTGVTSTLCYGVQWDAMLEFMGKDTETNSTEWGNYKNNEITIDRPTARWTSSPASDTTWTLIGTKAKKKTNTESILLTTGASDEFEVKNIYDVAGNCYEWTMEAHSFNYRVSRGRYLQRLRRRRPSSVYSQRQQFVLLRLLFV